VRCCADTRRRFLVALAGLAATAGILLAPVPARAGTPPALAETHAGRVNFVGTAGSLRRDPDSGDACAVDDLDTAVLSGLPAGATIRAARLYWAGSWSDDPRSTQRIPDWSVTLDGATVDADTRFTEFRGTGRNRQDWFGGRADVTALVAAKGNGAYTFGDLSVNTARPHCGAQTVVAGWSLIVVYEHSGEPERALKIFEGFQACQGGSMQVTADDIRVAAGAIDGKVAHLTWEGDAGISGALGGFSEGLAFEGHDLADGASPPGNQFNSTVNAGGRADTWGVDFDVYDVTPWLAAGQTSATAVYQSGQDLVLLATAIISVTNTPLTDLAFASGPDAPLPLYEPGRVSLSVLNNGPGDEPGPAVLRLTLPGEVRFDGTASPGWTVDAAAAPDLVFTHAGPLPAGAGAPLNLDLTALVLPTAPVALNVSVTSGSFDFDPTNNAGSVPLEIAVTPAELVSTHHLATLDDPVNGTVYPKAIPGATVLCQVTTSNLGAGEVDNNSVEVVLAIPPDVMLVVTDYPGGVGPIHLEDGTPPSGLTIGRGHWGNGQEDVSFSNDGGASFRYKPVADALGCDGAVTHVRVRPSGTFLGRTADGPSGFSLFYRVLVRY
jgi:MSHA biogenesis protein MshQ